MYTIKIPPTNFVACVWDLCLVVETGPDGRTLLLRIGGCTGIPIGVTCCAVLSDLISLPLLIRISRSSFTSGSPFSGHLIQSADRRLSSARSSSCSKKKKNDPRVRSLTPMVKLIGNTAREQFSSILSGHEKCRMF
jgi:hypothetical protein